MFLTRPDQEAPGLMLWNQQHQSYLHYVPIPSEPEPFCSDKPIPEALPLPEAPPAVRLVHLYKLLCGGSADCASPANGLPVRGILMQEKGKTRLEPGGGRFVVDAPA